MTWAADNARPGYWMIRCGRNCPFVAARIWIEQTTRDPVSNEPMDRSPFLAAKIGLDIVDWREVWAAVEFCEASQMQRHGMVNPPQSARAPRNGRSPALMWAPLAKWKQERARRITETQYQREIEWLEWASRNRPDHPDYTYRKAIDLKAVSVPKWANRERLA